jgi:hypothetical protein
MKFDLAAMARRAKNPRRTAIPLRDIRPPATMATDLYRSCYLPVVQAWSDAQAPIMAEYERTLAQMTTDSPADIDRELGKVDGLLQRIFLELSPRLRSWILRVERWHRGRWRGAALSATGVDLETMMGPTDVAETMDTALARNVALVKDVSTQARGRIADAVFRGLTSRLPARDVAADVRSAVDMSRRRATAIASDQLSKLSSALDGERMRQAGIEQFKWVHSGKLHPRSWHRARNGVVYDLQTRVPVNGGAPIPPDDMPGVPPYCGCRKLAVVTFD